MKKVCFIKLNEPWQFDPYSDPPLGLLSVMSAAKNIPGLELRLLDMAHEKEIPPADIYAISACTYDYPETLRIAKTIKETGGRVVVGGPHFDALPLSHLRQIETPSLDIICRGEGERTFPLALEAIESGKTGVISPSGILKPEEIPIPAREFLDKTKYFKSGRTFGKGVVHKQGNSATMMTDRGCPYNCSFCSSPTIHQGLRFRPLDSVKKELEILVNDYGVTEIRFQDDCFGMGKRFDKLSQILEQLGVRYRCSMRTDQVKENMLKKLWDSGCREIGFGIETAEDYILKLLNKRTTVAQNKEALRRTKEYGFTTRVFIMTSLPGETKDSAKYMINFLEQSNPDIVTLNSFIPLPGCDIFNNPHKYGVRILHQDWSKYNIILRQESNVPFVHTISTATMGEMERNRELLKSYLFNKGITNAPKLNKPYDE